MKEVNHNNLEYEGTPGEGGTISITANGTSPLVVCTVDGVSKPLQGGKVNFNLKNTSGQQTIVQLVLEFNHQGSYEVAVEAIPNCSVDTEHVGRCINIVDGPPKAFLTLAFSVA